MRIRGLPPTVALSEGHSIAPGSWAVPHCRAPNLKITLPAGLTGASEISITLVGSDGTVLAEGKVHAGRCRSLAAGQPGAKHERASARLDSESRHPGAGSPGEPGARAGIDPAGRSGETDAPEQRERALRLVKRGDEQLAEGGIAQARLLYERAAEAGLAQGAMALAATYDAAELSRLGVRGLQPDRAVAMRWYERARQLGAAEAEQRLRRLGAN